MACTTISATWGVLSRIMGRASTHDAQNADFAHLVADVRPNPPIPGKCPFRLCAWCLLQESFHCLPHAVVVRSRILCSPAWWHGAQTVVGPGLALCIRSCHARTLGCRWVFPRLSGPVAGKLLAPTPAHSLALCLPCSTPWSSLGATLSLPPWPTSR